MILIVGLGNPGQKYQNTRHNLGFEVVDKLARKLLPGSKIEWSFDRKANAEVLKIDRLELLLVKPQTFMNSSGFAVKSLITSHQPLTTNLWIIHDDLDLPLGRIKISWRGGAAGHKGIKSIINRLGSEDFIRFRLGISKFGKKIGREKTEKFVLSGFDLNELGKVRVMIKKTVEAVELALKKGIEKSMNKYN